MQYQPELSDCLILTGDTATYKAEVKKENELHIHFWAED